jgi:hypothetical protein
MTDPIKWFISILTETCASRARCEGEETRGERQRREKIEWEKEMSGWMRRLGEEEE